MFQRTLRRRTSQKGRNFVPISKAAPLQYLLIPLKVVALQKVSLVIGEFLRLFVNTLPANDKHYMLNRNNLTQPIQIQLSQKQKIFSEFVFPF